MQLIHGAKFRFHNDHCHFTTGTNIFSSGNLEFAAIPNWNRFIISKHVSIPVPEILRARKIVHAGRFVIYFGVYLLVNQL